MTATEAPKSELAAAGRFRDLIESRLGLHFDDTKLGFLADVMRRRVQAGGRPEKYLDELGHLSATDEELRLLATELTVTETYFFRNNEQFRAFAEVVIPDRMNARGQMRSLRFLSAGCASGEEPYSIAMVMRDQVLAQDPSWGVRIDALDMNTAALARARRGVYSAWALRETPPEVARKWFTSKNKDFVLDASIREAVRFHQCNLVENDPLWQAEQFDAIFCRNVLMYFAPDYARTIVQRIERSLLPGGYLFLGHAENLRGLSQEFQLCHTHGTFYYRKKDRRGPEVDRSATGKGGRAGSYRGVYPAELVESADTWVEAIGHAAERIKMLTRPRSGSADETEISSDSVTPSNDLVLRPAMELFQMERYGQALDHLSGLPSQLVSDPDVLLLRAALLTQKGLLDEAFAVCEQLLARDELNAGAHYLLALCCEGRGEREGAVEHDQAAIYLDSEFAMPHLHLGLMARRNGDLQSARGELKQAHLLFEREDPARILLFGGGFNRESLLALCCSELKACGEMM